MDSDYLVFISVVGILLLIFLGGGYLVGRFLLYRREAVIACNACGYKGVAAKGRSPTLAGTSLILVFGMPIWTALYFYLTKKWRCPNCRSNNVKEVR
ncbi:MAG: hypothetical protein UY22_C0043G0011 [Candidatus Amesbacteria bacterium GW2011_GWC1_48_10]|uniref:Uncharacterized protein n=2 Tax=Patescibacteria group TaxID=1783273 RepID=A0A0G1XAP0_9BACT|nr:MAG: hypothetical protein UY22_C0043G0011 [Candidatus Amesbacteria bacterium GW2011_GWC1_48_10]KKW22758.1 MAG: hypothetical protein UY67_C0036G0008 [Candidatus Kaiserbacteria bacterium GW2011_GWA2_52_12]